MIKIGDMVRSFDFPGIKDCYMEGVVKELVEMEGCMRYRIAVKKSVVNGIAVHRKPTEVFPPVNGTPNWMGGVCNGVELV